MAGPSEPFLGTTCGRCLLENTDSFRWPRGNGRVSLCLTDKALEYTNPKGSPEVVDLSDVIGARASDEEERQRGGGRTDGAGNASGQGFLLEVYAYVPTPPRKGCAKGVCSKHRRALHLTWGAADSNIASTWAAAINDILRSPDGKNDTEAGDGGGGETRGSARVGPGRRLLVLVNPVSGRGQSLSAWEKTLRPMLQQSMADVTSVISTRPGEIEDVVRLAGRQAVKTSTRNGGLDVGGGKEAGSMRVAGEGAASAKDAGGSPEDDAEGGPGGRSRGDVVDVGFLDDFDGLVVVGGDGTFFEALQGLYARPDYERQLARLSLGTVPAGTGNGLAKTVCEESGEEFGVVGASFLVAKGSSRKMDLLPTEVGDKKYLGFLNVGWGMVSDVDMESEAYRWMGSLRFTVGTIVRIIGLRHYRGRISFVPAGTGETGNSTDWPDGYQSGVPSLSEAAKGVELPGPGHESSGASGDSGSWRSVEGNFVLVDVAQVKYISHDMPMAPSSRLGDGLMNLFFIREGAGRLDIIKMFLAMENGEHVSLEHPCLEWHKVTAYRIEPLTSKGRLTVDGELMEYLPLQQRVWARATNVMCSSSGNGAQDSRG